MNKIKCAAAVICAAVISAGCTDNSATADVTATVSQTVTTVPVMAETVQTTCEASQTVPTETEASVADKAVLSFSKESGVYAEQFELELSSDYGEIYYTTDGSDPTDSDSKILYTAPIPITDRKSDKNVVSAVDPLLFSGTFCKVADDGKGFISEVSAPADEAVDKCTVIRAAVKGIDGVFSEETSLTYFIGTTEEHIEGLAESCEAAGTSLAVMSICVNYDDLFSSDKGIYVKGDIFDKALEEYLREEGAVRDSETARSLDANYKQRGREWERDAAVTLFEFDKDNASAVLSQSCGIRIQGNYSRSDLQKGFRLYARKDYGENNFDYPVFGDEYVNKNGKSMDKFDTLVLRNGGNCAFTSKFNDAYWQSLVTELSCSTQRSRPCVVYLNGEYWGLYILQEDYTDDYMEDYYGVNKDDVVIYKGDAEALRLGYKLDEGKLPDGIDDETYYFHELYDFFRTHKNLSLQEDYDEFAKLVDPDSVLDYFAVQCWIDNKWDWPGKNWSMWKTVSSGDGYGDGRWRMMFYDIEFGGVCGEGDAGNNTIKNANYKRNGLLDTDTDNPAVLCFAYLMTNDDFYNRFCERLTELSQTNFEKTAALERLDEFTSVYAPLFSQFFARYEGAGTAEEAIGGDYATPECIRAFLELREENIHKQTEFCEKVLKKDTEKAE